MLYLNLSIYNKHYPQTVAIQCNTLRELSEKVVNFSFFLNLGL